MEPSILPRTVKTEYSKVMDSVRIKDAFPLQSILKVISLLDYVRWEYPANYSTVNYTLINYPYDDLTPDEKLLTHWLCYITDRQMQFERIWEVGGYVFSHIVRTYTRSRDKDVVTLLEEYIRSKEQDKGGLSFECEVVDGSEAAISRLNRFGGTQNGNVRFSSRYVPDDIVRIFHTLSLLDKTSNRSLTRFIANAMPEMRGRVEDYRVPIRRIAASLNALSYGSSSMVSAGNYQGRLREAADKVERIAQQCDLTSDRCTISWLDAFDPFGRKRLWCSLRDYLKSPEFNTLFVSALQDIGRNDSRLWERDNPGLLDALDVIELPGDVWNNNSVFREGLFTLSMPV